MYITYNVFKLSNRWFHTLVTMKHDLNFEKTMNPIDILKIVTHF